MNTVFEANQWIYYNLYIKKRLQTIIPWYTNNNNSKISVIKKIWFLSYFHDMIQACSKMFILCKGVDFMLYFCYFYYYWIVLVSV